MNLKIGDIINIKENKRLPRHYHQDDPLELECIKCFCNLKVKDIFIYEINGTNHTYIDIGNENDTLYTFSPKYLNENLEKVSS